MLVTTKQAYVFHKTVQAGEGMDAVHTVVDTYKLPLTNEPVPAPDWIKETLLWELAIKDGTLRAYEASSRG